MGVSSRMIVVQIVVSCFLGVVETLVPSIHKGGRLYVQEGEPPNFSRRVEVRATRAFSRMDASECLESFRKTTGNPSLPVGVGSMLASRGIEGPTAIQAAACGRLNSGGSALLCAETGSGKSLAFLLPCLARLPVEDEEACVMVVAPTRELAVQLASEACRVTEAVFGAESVELLTQGTATTLGALRKARCIVATPREWVKAFQGRAQLAPKLASVRTLVLDEVDALLPPAAKDYRSKRSKDRERAKTGAKEGATTAAEKKKRQLAADAAARAYPTALLLGLLLKANPRPDLQLVGASATASRQTRDALDKLAAGQDPYGRFARDASLDVVRPDSLNADEVGLLGATGRADEKGATVHDHQKDASMSSSFSAEARPRAVAVPTVVDHGFSRLEKKAPPTVAAKAVVRLLERRRPRSALVFLTEGSGYTVAKTTSLVADLLAKQGLADDFAASALHDRLFGAPDRDEPLAETRRLEQTRAGLADEFAAVGDDRTKNTPTPVLFTFEATARGLHFDAVDLVLVLGLPKTPSSYLHLAGRAGRRLGGALVPGTVVTLCPPKAVSVLRSWSKQLGDVHFRPLFPDDRIQGDSALPIVPTDQDRTSSS